jgi:hypothetical protein
MIMGVIYKKFGKLRLGEPYIPGKRISFPEVPPPGFEYEDAGSPPARREMWLGSADSLRVTSIKRHSSIRSTSRYEA